MALPVLDGNQTATTLSSVVTGGEHIVAHSVVSLGANAIANITSAVSGSVVSISNFPSTQTIAGTVTANLDSNNFNGALTSYVEAVSSHNAFPVEIAYQPSVTIGSLPAISGTVTANLFGEAVGGGPNEPTKLQCDSNGFLITSLYRSGSDAVNYDPVAGNVSVNVKNVSSVTIGSVPNGSLTTHFGTPTTANVSFATSAVTNANRKYLLIQNVTTGSNVITVGIGFTPTTTQGIQLTAGAGITFESSYIPTGAVRILSSVTASNFTILEA